MVRHCTPNLKVRGLAPLIPRVTTILNKECYFYFISTESFFRMSRLKTPPTIQDPTIRLPRTVTFSHRIDTVLLITSQLQSKLTWTLFSV